MAQRYASRQRSIPKSREGPNEEKGGSGIRVPVSCPGTEMSRIHSLLLQPIKKANTKIESRATSRHT